MTDSPLVSLVVPTYNESENIIPFLESSQAVLKPFPYEIIVVDDDSPDFTWEKALAYAKDHPHVRVHRRVGERGLSGAVLKGFEMAKGAMFAVMDADQSHDEKILPALINHIQRGADLAVGSRRIPGGGADKWPWYRRFTSDIATRLAKGLLDIKLSDPMSGYFVVRRSLYEACKEKIVPMGYKILLEIYCMGRPSNVQEVPFIFRDRTLGHSKLTGGVMKEYLRMLIRLRS